MEEEIMNNIIQDESEPIIVPNIYLYSRETNEYVGFRAADKDPEESRIRGEFVPLIPANATLLEVPEYSENEIPVYTRTIDESEIIENWEIENDYRKNFLKVDNELNVFKINTIGEQEGYIIVDKATGEDIQADKNWYKIVNNEVVKKSEEEYEQERAEKREQVFKNKFFKVSNYGYYRRQPKGYQSAVESMNVLFNIANVTKGLQAGLIIFYQEPDFTDAEQCTEEWLIEHQIIMPAMTLEEFLQLYVVFMTAWNTEEHEKAEVINDDTTDTTE